MTTPGARVERDTHINLEPTLAFNGDPNRIPVQMPERISGYKDLVIEALTPEHEAFEEYAKAYVAHILNKQNIEAGNFVWPPFKLSHLKDMPDEAMYDAEGNMHEEYVVNVIRDYLIPTIKDKGNHLLVLHGLIDGKPGFIGGGLSFDSVDTEDEGWISKGIIARNTNGKEHRGNGLGRIIQEARVMHWMLEHPQLNNLNTGVNINEEGCDRFKHVVTSQVLGDMSILHKLRTGETIKSDDIQSLFSASMRLRVEQGYAENLIFTEEEYKKFVDKVENIIGPWPLYGFTPESVRKGKDIIAATAELLGVPLTPTEHTFLGLGGRHLNAIENSARVKGKDELNHTRRLIIVREDWEALAKQRYPDLASYLDQAKRAA